MTEHETVAQRLERLRAQRDEAEARLRALHEEIGEADATEEQVARWEKAEAEIRTLREQIEQAERQQRMQEARARYGSVNVSINDNPFDGDLRMLPSREVRDRAMRVMEDRETGGHLRDDQKAHIERLLRSRSQNMDGDVLGRLLLATENKHYRSAFQKVAAGRSNFTAQEVEAIEQVRMVKRAMALSPDSAGGFAVPVLIDPTVILTAQESPNDILRLARVETITTDEWHGVTSAGMTWKFDAEGAPATNNAPSIDQPAVKAHRADGFIPFTIEVGMDWPGFAEEMATLLAEGYSELLAEKLTTGTGSNQPTGLVTKLNASTNPIVKVTVGTGGQIAPADVYKVWDALPIKYRRRAAAAWLSSTSVQNAIRQLGTLDPNFTINLTEEAIPRLFGREYGLNDFMADAPTSTGTEPLLVVGDFRGYLVAQRAGMNVEFVPHVFDSNGMPTGKRGWFAWARVGADAIVPHGFRMLVNKT